MPADCPNHDQLRTWLDDESVDLSNHIDTCAFCQQSVQTMLEDYDEFLHSFREVALHAANPSQQRSLDAIKEKVVQRLSTDSPVGAQEGNADEWIGRRLGQYEIEELVGKGGMGRVYRARHIHLQKDVAIKLLLASRASHGQAADRFAREWVASAKVTSPHVVQALDAGKVDNVAFLVLEFLEGLNLRKLRQATSQLSIPIACELVRQATVGLKAIDDAGLVHRDIKPSNLMLTSDGVVKLLDLGLARFNESESPGDGELTASGVVLGTMQFMAPEQCRKPGEADVRADLYSLGCTLYYLLTGQPPFHGPSYESIYDVMRGHVKDEVPSIAKYRDDVPEDLIAIVDKLLAKAPEDRFATPTELIDALSSFATEVNLQSLAMTAVRDNEATRETEPNRLGQTVSYSRARPAVSNESAIASSFIGLINHRRGKLLIAASLLLLAGLLLGMTPVGQQAIRVVTNCGQLVIQDVAPNITVIVRQDKVVIKEGKERRFNLRVGEYDIALIEPDGTELHAESFRITRGGNKIVEVKHETTPEIESIDESITGEPRPKVTVRVPDLTPLPTDQLDNRFGVTSLVSRPSNIPGVLRWTVETKRARGEVERYAFDPSGEQIAAGGSDGVVRVFREADFNLVGMFPGLTSVTALCWSPDAAYVAAGDAAGKILIWQASTGKVVGQCVFAEPSQTGITSLAWSPDGARLGAGVPGRVVVFVDLHSGATPDALDHDDNAVIAWSHDGTRLALAGSRGMLKIREVATGQLVVESQTSDRAITGIAWSPDDRLVATAASSEIRVSNLQGESVATLNGEWVTWPEVGSSVISGDGKNIRIWDTSDWQLTNKFQDHKGTWKIKPAVSSPDGNKLLYGRFGESDLCVVDLQRMTFRYAPPGIAGSQAVLSWDSSQQRIASAHGEAAEIVVFDPANSPPITRKSCSDNGVELMLRSVSWSPDGNDIASGGAGTVGVVGAVQDRLRVLRDDRVANMILDSDWSEAGIATRSIDGRVVVWDFETGQVSRLFDTARDTVGALSWSPDKNKLAFGSKDTIQVWDRVADKLTQLVQHDGRVSALAWSPDSEALCFNRFGTVFVRHLSTGVTTELRRGTNDAHRGWVWSIAWPAKGKQLVTHGDSCVRIWGVEERQMLEEISVTPADWLSDPTAISSNGKTIAVCGSDRTVRLWRTEDGEPFLNYTTLDEGHWLVATPDGNWLGSEGVESELVYLVESDAGVQRLTPTEMQKRFGWEPNAASVHRLLDAAFSASTINQ